MSCHDCAKSSEGCGCQQDALSINQICNPVVCSTPQCSESFDANCIVYTGEDLVDNNGVVIATNGQTIAQVFANMIAFFTQTNNALKKGYADDIGIGNSATAAEDTLVFSDTITRNTLAADGEEFNIELFYAGALLGNVTIRFAIAGVDVIHTVTNVNAHKGLIRITMKRIDSANGFIMIHSKEVDNGTLVTENKFVEGKHIFNFTLDQPLAIYLNNAAPGANQILVRSVNWGTKNL